MVKVNNLRAMMARDSFKGLNSLILDFRADICVFNNKKWFFKLKELTGTMQLVDSKHLMKIGGCKKVYF